MNRCINMNRKNILYEWKNKPLIEYMPYGIQSVERRCIKYFIILKISNERILVDPTSNIRSSQRLSHACLSTNYNKVKPQKAQYNSCNFLDHIPSTWITVENLELIHAYNTSTRQKVLVQLLDKPINHFGGCFLWWNSR